MRKSTRNLQIISTIVNKSCLFSDNFFELTLKNIFCKLVVLNISTLSKYL